MNGIPTPAVPASASRWWPVLKRGVRGTCPRCGQAPLFRGYVKQFPSCSFCSLDLEAFRADDGPAYFTILIVGHVVVPTMLMTEIAYHPATWIHMVVFLPMTIGLTLALLPRIKGAMIGLQFLLSFKT
ncbi:MAG TPA: DUF983 domain-containing protein [Stellaceae bacterium]|nr:DUF983 domain-containing protein [Stellaceae bacterium]